MPGSWISQHHEKKAKKASQLNRNQRGQFNNICSQPYHSPLAKKGVDGPKRYVVLKTMNLRLNCLQTHVDAHVGSVAVVPPTWVAPRSRDFIGFRMKIIPGNDPGLTSRFSLSFHMVVTSGLSVSPLILLELNDDEVAAMSQAFCSSLPFSRHPKRLHK